MKIASQPAIVVVKSKSQKSSKVRFPKKFGAALREFLSETDDDKSEWDLQDPTAEPPDELDRDTSDDDLLLP